jgi:hypothetical protein
MNKNSKTKMRTRTTILTIPFLIVAASLALSMNVPQAQEAPVTVTWQLSINVIGDATGTILTVDGRSYNQSQLSEGLALNDTAGSAGHTVLVTTPIAAGPTKRYVFSTWTGPPLGVSASSPNGTFTWPTNSWTVTANYVTQYLQTLSYSVIGGGAPSAPRFTADQLGSPFSQTLTDSATGCYFDSGSSWTVSPNPLAGSENSERWQSNQTLNGTISGAQTLNITYYHQFSVIFTYTVVGGGSPASPTVDFTQYGSSASVNALASPGTQGWVDSGSTYSYSNPLVGSTSTERWSTYSATGNISATLSVNPSFYHQFRQTLSYSVVGGGNPTEPAFAANQYGSPTSVTLTSTASDTWFDANTSWTVGPNPLTGSGDSERWASNQTLSGSVSAAQTLTFTFYHQFKQTLSYKVTGGGTGYSAPSFKANQFGASTPQLLTTAASGYWFDYGSSWLMMNLLGGSTSSEQWLSPQTVSGTISAAQMLMFSYSHQYYLTVSVNPAGSGNTSYPSGFYDSGCSVQILATANPGYAFKNWVGSGAGSVMSDNNPVTVTMSAAITETAFFTSQPAISITVTSDPTGPSFLSVDGTPIATPHTYSWIPGATHTIAASSPVSGGTGVQYVWQSWNDGGMQSHTITVSSSVTTFTATFQQQYQLSINATTGGTTDPPPGSHWYYSGQSVSVTALANSGYAFSNWLLDGGNAGSASPLTVTMSSAHTLTGNYVFFTSTTVFQIVATISGLLTIIYSIYRVCRHFMQKPTSLNEHHS